MRRAVSGAQEPRLEACFTNLLMLYFRFTYALLPLYLCFTYALLLGTVMRRAVSGAEEARLGAYFTKAGAARAPLGVPPMCKV
jgi:hypothetical protein